VPVCFVLRLTRVVAARPSAPQRKGLAATSAATPRTRWLAVRERVQPVVLVPECLRKGRGAYYLSRSNLS
jgi:hypothetical protein